MSAPPGVDGKTVPSVFPRWSAGNPPRAEMSGLERAPQVVEDPPPPALVRAHRLLVPQAAVGEADGGGSVALLEVDLDQRAPPVAIPDPGECEPVGAVDLGVDAAPAVVDAPVRVAHHDAHGAANAQVDLRLAGLPAELGLPPAADHLR